MVLVNGGYLHCTDIKKFLSILLWKRQTKIGQSNLKNSGEQSRAILALLLSFGMEEIIQSTLYHTVPTFTDPKKEAF